MLLLLDRGELMLEKRPAQGVWGGLWSLPELQLDADPASYCRERLGCVALAQHPLPRLTHGFTHFKLNIQPIRLHVSPRDATPSGVTWLPPAVALGTALPAPVRKLVLRLGRD
jgi:A/G-specific adenine glycosylase